MNNPFFLEDAVFIDGRYFNIRTDFRTWMGYEKIMSSGLSHIEKCARCIRLCYIELPPSLSKAAEALMSFYTNGEVRKGGKNKKVLFDFEKDFGYIYASFMAEYGIDLYECDLHWHKFLHLLSALGDESIFKKIIFYRGCDLSKIKDKTQKAFLRRMKHLYALEKDADADIADAF